MRTSAEKRAFDWTEASARLERVARKLGAGEERSPEEIERILEERARHLARPATTPPAEDLAAVVVFPLARERYAVDLAGVAEVVPLRGLAPLPGAPAPVLGIVLHRGRLVPVVDLRRLLGGGEAARAHERGGGGGRRRGAPDGPAPRGGQGRLTGPVGEVT